MNVTTDIGLEEDITDILTKDGIKSGQFAKGQLLKFMSDDGTPTYIKIIKISVKKGTAMGKHIQPSKTENVSSHYGHNVDSTTSALRDYGCPFCTDCDMPVSQKNNKVDDDNVLSDGTRVE